MNCDIPIYTANSSDTSDVNTRPLTIGDIRNEILSDSSMSNCPIEFMNSKSHVFNILPTRLSSEILLSNEHHTAVEGASESLKRPHLFPRETIEDYCYGVSIDSLPVFDVSLVDLSQPPTSPLRDAPRPRRETIEDYCYEEYPTGIDKNYIFEEIVQLLKENNYLRNQLQTVCTHICPDAQNMYCDTSIIDRVTKNLLNRWDEFDVVHNEPHQNQNQDISRVTLTRGSNAVDLTEDDINRYPHYDTWDYLPTVEGGYDSGSTHSSMPGLVDMDIDEQEDYDEEDTTKYDNRDDYDDEDDEEKYFNNH
jgi:hypothetical protein